MIRFYQPLSCCPLLWDSEGDVKISSNHFICQQKCILHIEWLFIDNEKWYSLLRNELQNNSWNLKKEVLLMNKTEKIYKNGEIGFWKCVCNRYFTKSLCSFDHLFFSFFFSFFFFSFCLVFINRFQINKMFGIVFLCFLIPDSLF